MTWMSMNVTGSEASMGISSLNSSSLQSILSLQNLLSTPTQSSSTAQSSDFSKALQASDASTATNTQKSDSLSMLKALMVNSSIDSSNLLLQALDNSETDRNTNKSNTLDSLFSLIGTPTSADPLMQALNASGSDSSSLGIDGIQPADSNVNQLQDSLYNSDFALLDALTNSGMSASQITQVLNTVNLGSQYNQQGTMGSSGNSTPNLFSGIA